MLLLKTEGSGGPLGNRVIMDIAQMECNRLGMDSGGGCPAFKRRRECGILHSAPASGSHQPKGLEIMSTPSTIQPTEEIDYPDSDGQPMAENTLQFRWITTIQGGLDALFRDNPDVFVAGDLFWYPVQGSNTIRTAPDALVAFGRPKGYRGSYMQWREGNIAPQVVWEILSPGNRAGELDDKFEFYRRYGVEEYYQYDPDRDRLRGWRREGDQLREILPIEGWISPRLGIRLEMEAGELVIYRPDGERFQTYLEMEQDKREERLGRLAAEARTEQERQRAEQERQQREAAQQRAEQLAAKLRALGIDPDA